MSIDVSHLVLVSFCDTNNQVVNECANGPESSNILAIAMVQLDVNDVFRRVRERDSKMTKVLGEFAYTYTY